MIIDVDGYNTEVEFPDDTPPETIKRILREKFPPLQAVAPPSAGVEPIPFDLDGTLAMADPENTPHRSEDMAAVLWSGAKPWISTGYTAAASLNRSLGMMATHLDLISDYVARKTGTEKGGIFERAAKQYQDNASYWQERASKVGVTFLEELLGEATGGAVPGVAEFALNIPYAGLLGAAKADKEGNSEVAGALTEAAKRGVLGLVFKAMQPLKQYLRAPAMGAVFGAQTAAEGGDTREIAKGVGTGALFSLSSPGGKMGLNEIRRDLEKKIVLQEAEKPVEEPPTLEERAGMAPEAGFRREPSSVSGKSDDPIARRSDLVRFLTEKLDIPIRTGRFRDKALGIFKIKPEVIRTEKANDIEVISHEIGHALQKFLYPDSVTAKGLSSLPFAAFDGELTPLATRPKTGQEVVPEGFAEFVRLYITDPQKAQDRAPSFYDHFEHLLDTRSPESLEILLAARAHYQKWLEQPSLQRVLSQVSVGEKEKRPTSIHDLYTKAVDDLHPLKQIVEAMAPPTRDWLFRKKDALPATEDPYKLARLFRGWSGKVDAFLRHSPFKFSTYEDVGKSLQEILRPLDGRLDEFRAYIVSRRTLDLLGRPEKVETGILEADAREVINRFDKDFSQAFEDLKEYQDHCLNYLRDSGILDNKTYAKIKALNDDYVPLYRVMEGTEGKGIGKGLQARNPIKKIKGSWRDIQDPLESIVKNTYLYINMAERNAIGEALVKLAEGNEGMGKFVEKIPTPMQAIKIKPEELERFGLENIPEDAVAIFRPSAFMPSENVISVWRKGKQTLYEVHPDVARTFQALDKENVNLITKILSYPASWLRAGATLTPEFIGRNPIRDQFSGFVYSKFGFVPSIDFIRGIFAMATKNDLYWEWKKGGGDHAMLVSMDRAYMQDRLADVLQKYPVRNLIKNPIEALRILSEINEAGTRIGEFGKGIKKEGRTKAGIQEAALSSREATLDFARKGAAGNAINRIVAFWNASLQGQDRMIRAFKDDPIGATWRTAISITLPSVLLAIYNHDDPRVKDLPQWQKDLFWIIPQEHMSQERWDAMSTKEKADHLAWITGTIWRLPKPFELGILFGSVPERVTRYILDQDPHAFDGLLQSIGRAGLPGIVPTGAIGFLENWANRSMFFDRPVVPQNRTDLLPEYQYGPYTSETAKELGKVLGKLPWMDELPVASPAKIENLVYGWTGGLGRYAMQISDMALEAAGVTKPVEKAAKTLADYPFIKAFVVRYPSASTENITRFYDSYESITKRLKSMKAMEKEGRFDEVQRLMEGGQIENLNGIHQSLKNLHGMVDAVTANPLLKPDEKREFTDILYLQMTEVAKAGNELVDTLNEQRKAAESVRARTLEPAREPAKPRPPAREKEAVPRFGEGGGGRPAKEKQAGAGQPVF